MADRVLVIAWGAPVRGAEERGLEVFNEALGLLGRKQQEGQIDSFDVALFEPNPNVNGIILIRGNSEQINALREDDEFRRNTIAAQLIVDDLRHVHGYTNEGIAEAMSFYQEAIATVPQRA
jgi:ribosomal protein S7